MITGLHALVYSRKADEARAFFRDVLDLPCVDAEEGWLIFRAPPAELAVHPTDADEAKGASRKGASRKGASRKGASRKGASRKGARPRAKKN
jgi:catechol 2,3-dioxygenase-like lactoylglutathione lyase family enzyme